MLLWMLMACDEFGLKSETSDTGLSGADEIIEHCDGELCIDDISPNWGPSTGGTEVRIYGSGFDGDIGVSFARLELSAITRLGPNELVLTSPQGSNGPIDVTVWSDYGEVVVENGFTYSDSGAPPDTGFEDSGSGDTGSSGEDNSGAGQIGGVIEYSMVVDGYLLASTEGYSINANAMLHEPTSGSWLSWLAPVGSCLNFTGTTPLSNTPLSFGNWAYLTAPNSSIPMQFNGSQFVSSNLVTSDYIKGNSYDLSIPDQDLEIPNAVVTAMGMGQTFGPSQFFAGGDYSTNYYMSTSTYFTWDVDSDASSTMLFIFEVLDGTTFDSLGAFQCHSSDVGSYQLPPDIFTGALYGDIIIVQMLRLRTTSSINPMNGSTIEGFSTTGGIGVAIFVQ
jgi:hypothetical protein